MDTFAEGDLVAVFGGEMGKDAHVADSVTQCTVVTVGQDDLVVEHAARYSTAYHLVPKSICVKLHLEPGVLSSARVLTPEVGDLVTSYPCGYKTTDTDKTSGIVYKITYRLGKADKCVLLCGTDMETVDWTGLIVLDRPGS